METAPSGGAAVGYSESVDSSPRSRGGESWDEPFPSSAASAKLRLMCSYGGHIVPRPHDKTLCYLGGDTRIVVVDRNTTLADLSSKLSRSLLGGRPFSLKYQLPSEDLDSLISLTTEEDLDNMIEEYDRISSSAHGGGGGAVGKTSRLRLFLFPLKVESSPASSIGSLLDDSKSETWFVDALNGSIGIGGVLPRGLSADSAASSVNCLLGLEEDQNHSSVPAMVDSSAVVGQNGGDQVHYHHHQMLLPRPDSSGKLSGGKHGQEVQSVPDSPMLDTSSSFGSTSSAPCLSNLPPIRVRPDDRGADQRGTGGGLEEHFSQMNLSVQKQEEGLKDGGYVAIHHQHPAAAPINGAAAPFVPDSAAVHLSPSENPNEVTKVFSSDDEKLEHGDARKLPQMHPVQQQKPSNTFDLPVSERPVHHAEGGSPGADGWSGVPDPKQECSNPPAESNYRVLQAQASEQSYMLPIQAEPRHQIHSQAQQLQQQHQFIHANPQLIQHLPSNQAPHLVQHHPSTPFIPIQSYYQMPIHPPQPLTQTHPYGSQLPMYYVSVPQNPGYVMPMQQPNLVDTGASAGKPTPPLPTQVPPPRVVAPSHPPKPELIAATNAYRTSAPTGASVPQPSSSPQLIHLADQNHQYMGYPPMHLHQSQSVTAPNYGYEFSNPVHAQPIYYAQATSIPLPGQFQTVSSGATILSDAPSQLQQPDLKQTRASS